MWHHPPKNCPSQNLGGILTLWFPSGPRPQEASGSVSPTLPLVYLVLHFYHHFPKVSTIKSFLSAFFFCSCFPTVYSSLSIQTIILKKIKSDHATVRTNNEKWVLISVKNKGKALSPFPLFRAVTLENLSLYILSLSLQIICQSL